MQNQLPPEENEPTYYEPLSVSHLPTEPEKPPKLISGRLPGQRMLKVVSVLMIIYALFVLLFRGSFVFFLITFIIYTTLPTVTVMWLAWAIDILCLLALGVFGIGNVGNPAKAQMFVTIGKGFLLYRGVMAMWALLVSGFAVGILFRATISFIFPIYYIIGGFKLKKAASADDV